MPSPALQENRKAMDVLRPKELDTHPGEKIVGWARGQLEIARAILDNPGGGLVFATQTVGQVKAGLRERDHDRWASVIAMLDEVEEAAVHRDFDTARTLIDQAAAKLA
jgi:hypothetical protein